MSTSAQLEAALRIKVSVFPGAVMTGFKAAAISSAPRQCGAERAAPKKSRLLLESCVC